MDKAWTLQDLVAEAAARLEALPPPKNGQVRAVPDDRTIRYYSTLGLLDRPAAMRGRTALYGRRHLAQVVAIKRMQSAGKSLADIQALWPTLDDVTLARMSGVQLPAKSRAARKDFWKREPAAAPGGAGTETLPVPSTGDVDAPAPTVDAAASVPSTGDADAPAPTVDAAASVPSTGDVDAPAPTVDAAASVPSTGDVDAPTVGAAASAHMSSTGRGPQVGHVYPTAPRGPDVYPSAPQGPQVFPTRPQRPHVYATPPRPIVLPPAPAVAPSAEGRVELRIEIAPGAFVAVDIRDGISLTPADVRALRAAAAPLVTELANRGLIARAVGTLEEP